MSTALHLRGYNVVRLRLELGSQLGSRVDVLSGFLLKSICRLLLLAAHPIDLEREESLCPKRFEVLLGRVTLGLVLPVPRVCRVTLMVQVGDGSEIWLDGTHPRCSSSDNSSMPQGK